LGCSCPENEFTCDCITEKTCTKSKGCIEISAAINGFIHCPNQRVPLGINITRLNNVSECNDIGFPQCDNSTCFNTDISTCDDNECSSSHVICTSYCDDNEKCNGVFQCNDNRLILFSQFCDGIVNCFDGSDEIQNQPGFKCNRCVLPQSNLYDDFAHCVDKTDLCLNDSSSCFSCTDKRLLIYSTQVCDGVSDCYDMSDECLCEEYFDSEKCVSSFEAIPFQCFDNENLMPWYQLLNTTNTISLTKTQFIECETKFNSSIYATVCDGRPECRDFSDECNCKDPPGFCNDTCHKLFLMGDRYCDGVEDLAWKFINDSSCPKGFDELFCPKRFRCEANGKTSIDVLQICDGKIDCDNKLDENNCGEGSNIRSTFSSDTEMISNPFIKAFIWIIAFAVLAGNAYVIIITAALLNQKKTIDRPGFYHVIILNISIADFIMGVYLMTIACYSAAFSEIYGSVDIEWRSSLKCSIIGSLAVISSEASCFLMVVLSAFRLISVTKTVDSLTASLYPWKFCIIIAWLLSFFLSFAPTFNLATRYFLHSFSYSSGFHNGTLLAPRLTSFACRIAALSNKTIPFNGDEFQSAKMFVKSSLSDNKNVAFFGYYGETSVCMPRFYVAHGESSWEYTIFIITINFLSFIFVATSCIFILKYTSQQRKNIQKSNSKKATKQAAEIQKRIARIIITDFCCWIPICILAYVRLGVEFSDIVYQISAVLLLPINSAINPLLFTSLPEKLINLCRQKRNDLPAISNTSETGVSGFSKIQSKSPNSTAL